MNCRNNWCTIICFAVNVKPFENTVEIYVTMEKQVLVYNSNIAITYIKQLCSSLRTNFRHHYQNCQACSSTFRIDLISLLADRRLREKDLSLFDKSTKFGTRFA